MGFYLRLADAAGEGRTLAAGRPRRRRPRSPGRRAAPVADALAELERRAERARGRRAPRREPRLGRSPSRSSPRARQATRRSDARRPRRGARRRSRPRWAEAQLARGEARGGARPAAAARRARPRGGAGASRGRSARSRRRSSTRAGRTRRRGCSSARSAPRRAGPRRGSRSRRRSTAPASTRARRCSRPQTAAAFPTVPAAVRAAARAARRLGRLDEAAARLRTLLALRFDDAQARRALAQLLAERGDVAGAPALLAEALAARPVGRLAAAPARRPARRERPDGRRRGGVRRGAGALRPRSADAWERRGRARLAAGRARDAQADLQRALELGPQRPELKALARSLEPTRERFERPVPRSTPRRSPRPPRPPRRGRGRAGARRPEGDAGAPLRPLLELHADGGEGPHRRAAPTRTGATTLSWAPDRQEVRVERARVLKPDGTVVETHDESERSASEPWYRLYYDTTARTLSFPALAPGDVLEVAWRVEDVAGENLLSDYFGDLTFVDEPTRKARFEYVLLVPEARAIHANAPAGDRPRAADAPGRRGGAPLEREGRPARRPRARHAGLERGLAPRARLDLRRAGSRWPASTGGWSGTRSGPAPRCGRRPSGSPPRCSRAGGGVTAPRARAGGRRRGGAAARRLGPRDRARAGEGGVRLRGLADPLRRARVRHPRLQAVPGRPGARSAASATARTRRACSHALLDVARDRLAAGAPAHAAAGAAAGGARLAGGVQPRHRVRARPRPLARRHRLLLRHAGPPGRGSRRDGAGGEPGRGAALHHHPRGEARGEPGREPHRGHPRARRLGARCAAAGAWAAWRRPATGAPTASRTSAARSSSSSSTGPSRRSGSPPRPSPTSPASRTT